MDSDTENDSAMITATPSHTSGLYVPDNDITATVNDSGAAIVVSAAALSLTEGGATGTFTVKLTSAPASGSATLSVASDDTGAATVSPTTLDFTSNNWNTTQTVTVTAVADADGSDESVDITLSATSGYDDAADEKKTITVSDDDAGITVSAAALTITEGGATGSFTVELSAMPTSSVSLSVESGDTAAATVSPATLDFTSGDWDTGKTVTVTAVPDDDGSDESVTITLSSTTTGYRVSPAATKTIAVSDDDAGITVSAAAVTLDEGDAADSFTVELSAAPTSDVAVSVVSGDLQAATVDKSTLTFTADNWNMEQMVSVTPVADADGSDESVTITLSSTTTGYRVSPAVTKTITVSDDDAGITVSTAALTITEGVSTGGTFTVELEAAPTSNVAVSVVSGDLQAATVDKSTLTFTASDWNMAQTVSVTPVDDADGSDESVTITLSSTTTGYRVSPAATKTITVSDDDAGITVSADAVAITEGETTGGTFTVELRAMPTSDVALSVVSGDTGAATVSPATLNFTASNWETPQTVTVKPVDDTDGADESVTITLSSTTTGYRVSPAVTKTIAVGDDDRRIDLSAAAVTLTEGSGNTGSFTVELGAAPASNVTLSVASGDTAAVTLSPATLTFTSDNWDDEQTVTLTPVDDDDGTDESVDITLSSTSGYDADDKIKTITVSDDDGGITVSAAALTLTEGSGNTDSFTVALAVPPASSATFSVVSGDTQSVTATPATLTFTAANYNTPQAVTLTPVPDSDGTDESVTITLSATAGYRADNATKTIKVSDDDGGITVSAAAVTLTEDSGNTGSFTVTLAVPPIASATFSVTSGDTGALTLSPATLTFTAANYNTPQAVTLTPVPDDDGLDESVAITLSATAGYRAADATKTVAVTDDDRSIVLSTAVVNLTEGGETGSFTVALATAPASSATLLVKSGDTGAVWPSPVTLTFTAANYNTPQTVTLIPADDDDAQDETVTFTVSATGGYGTTTATKQVMVDDDEVSGNLVLDATGTLTVSEGASAIFTVKLDTRLRSPAKVSMMNTGTEITITPTTLDFTPSNWDKEQTVSVSAAHDPDATNEADRITVSLASTGGVAAPSLTRQVSVHDDEVMGNLVFDSTANIAIDEGGSAVITVKIDTALKRDATVSLSNINEDIRLSPRTLTFDSSNWFEAQSVLVIADPDQDVDDETDTIVLVSSEGLLAANTTRAVDITDGFKGTIIVRPTERLHIKEGESGVFAVSLGARPSATTTLSLSNTDRDITLSPASLSFDPPHWNQPQIITVSAAEDPDALDEVDILTLRADDFPTRRVIVEVKDETDYLPVRAQALAFPPATVQDSTILRLRCKQQSPCLVFLDCNAQSDASLFEGWIHRPIPGYGTLTLTAADIERYTGASWSGKGRLGCALRSAERIGAQVWTRSGNGVLVNNSAAIHSVPEGRSYRADIESIPSPDGPDESNIRIRCLAPEGEDCTQAGFSCFDDEGTRYDEGLGAIKRLVVYHMQSEELAQRIDYRWTGLGLSCEFRADNPFTVQVLTRTGGGGALVNNSATGGGEP